jgi:membrane-bound lytic murein transglycosylase B
MLSNDTKPQPTWLKILITLFKMLLIAAILSFIILAPKLFKTDTLQQFKKHVAEESLKRGVSQEVIKKYLLPAKLHISSKKIKSIISKHTTPERTFESYKKIMLRTASKKRLARIYKQHKQILDNIQHKYGIPMGYLVAIWCTETTFGERSGKDEMIPSLLTLAYLHPRRRRFFTEELIAALTILSRYPDINKKALYSTFDGGMGQTQLEPTSYLYYADRYQKNSAKKYSDIWSNPADALASAANYLKKNGWKKQYPQWGQEVSLNKAKYWQQLIDKKVSLPLSVWRKLGVKNISDDSAANTPARLVAPDGIKHSVYLVFPNFKTLLRWNRSPKEAILIGSIHDKLNSIITVNTIKKNPPLDDSFIYDYIF